MFCYQRSFGLPTEIVTTELFRALTTAPRTITLVKEARQALAQGDKATYDKKKKALPFVVFIATYDESVSAKGKKGCWRKQAACQLNGLCVIDFDHVDENQTSTEGEEKKRSVKEIWDEAYSKLSDDDKKRILLVYVTPSGHGLKVVFIADADKGNLIDNQIDFSKKLGLAPDEACKDASRGAFLTTSEDIIFIDEERLINYENEVFGEKYNAEYHAGHSQPTTNTAKNAPADNSEVELAGEYNGVPYTKIIEAWLDGKDLTNKRHDTLVELVNHLRYICGKNATLIEKVVMQLPWVQALASEGENIASTVASVIEFKYYERMPKKMREALERAGAVDEKDNGNDAEDDIFATLPLDEWAEELTEMAKVYPCMKELFVNVHPHKLPAILFSSAALFGTLMTRAYYHFWYEPELIRRLNYCIFIIGDPGAGKNVIEKFYRKIADPMIQADKCLIDAVNRYKEGRTERTTSTKAQKNEALKRPVVGIRVHPARTATGEFIRHMNAAIEEVQGMPLNLHMFSFDAELDNVTKQNRGGDWKDREILELKAFHNEEDGQMYANQESVTGMFNVFWNFIYTGTPYALHRKVNQRNFGTGMSTRLAVILYPTKGWLNDTSRWKRMPTKH